jgi:MFS family permease
VPLRIFRSRTVSAANVVQGLMVAGMFGMFFLGALYLQRVLGYDAIEVGLAFLPVALVIGTLSVGLSSRLIVRFGGKATLVPGMAFLTAGLLVFQRAPVDATYLVDLFPAMLLLGIGAGLSFPALMTLAMSGATPEDSGLASGLVNTTQQVGGALGLAVLATLSTTRSADLAAAGETTAQALVGGYRLAFAVGAALTFTGLVVAATVLRSRDAPALTAVPAAEEPATADPVLLDEAA